MSLLVKWFAILVCLVHCDVGGCTQSYLFMPLTINDSLSQHIVNCIFQDGRGVIGLRTQGGLCSYDGYEFIIFSYDREDSVSLSQCWIWNIFDDSNGDLCVANRRGLNKYNSQRNVLTRYFIDQDQLNNRKGNLKISICEDNAGHLWIETWRDDFTWMHIEMGVLNRFSPSECAFQLLKDQPLLAYGPIIRRIILVAKACNQQLWFGLCGGGLNKFDRVNREFVHFMELPERAATEGLNCIYLLSFDANNIRWIASYSKELDENWLELTSKCYVSYANLPHGEDTFRVREVNSDEGWRQKEASMLMVSPSFWQSGWFKLILLVLLIGILLSLYIYRLKRMDELERLRENIASDLHDEVGSSLTRISILSEQIQNTDDKNVILDASRKIGKISREVIDTMSDIVWSIDTRNDTIADLLDRMYDFAYSSLSLLDITISFSEKGLDKSKKIKEDCRQNIYYIFKEAVTNIVKYAQASVVQIILKNDDRNFFMEIKDDGRGFDRSKVSKGNGIKNMYMRARRIGGGLSIESDVGTKILLRTRKL